MRRTTVGTLVVVTLLATAAPGEAAGLARDPVAVVYDRDHALHVLNAGATDDELTLRTQTLASSAWAFFRGTSPLYYRDLGELPPSAYATAGGDVWLTGDTHLENTGADRGADNVEQFAINDTDDAWRGSWTWDLRREAVSIVLAGRANGRSASAIATDVDTFVAEYAQWIGKFHGTNDEASWRLTAGNTSDLVGDLIDASAADKRADLVAKWTTGGHFKADPELQTVSAATRTQLVDAVAAYRTTAGQPLKASEAVVKDVRRRTGAGTGSLGRFRWYVLVEGDTTSSSDDRILEFKQEVDPAPKQLAPNATPLTGGQRPALALRWLANQSDPLAGWATVGTTPVLVKEKSPFAEDLKIGDLTSSAIWDDTVRDVGRLLAAAHARADQDIPGTGLGYSADAAIDGAITSVPGLQAETRAFATSYADQVTTDWRAYLAAKDSGRPLF